jgi:CheY-like chemotaxis protein
MHKSKVDLAYIIDDDEVIIYLTEILVKEVEFCDELKTFTCAERALDALKVAFEKKMEIPSVILIDLNMPIMDGWRFLDQLIELDKEEKIAVFVFTSSIDPRDIERAKNYKMIKDYIVKPLTIHKINKILRLIK